MENKTKLLALVSVLSTYRTEYSEQISALNVQVRKIHKEKPAGIDPILELRIGLHKTFSTLVTTLARKEEISNEQAKSILDALQSLFEDKTSYQRVLEVHSKMISTASHVSDRWKELMHGIVCNLLLEAYCSEDGLLTVRAVEVLKLTRGLNGSKKVSIKEAGTEMNLPEDRIRTLKRNAEDKVWNKAKETGIEIMF